MKTVIIGSGNVAFHLAKAFTENNIPVAQIFGLNESSLKEIIEDTEITSDIRTSALCILLKSNKLTITPIRMRKKYWNYFQQNLAILHLNRL